MLDKSDVLDEVEVVDGLAVGVEEVEVGMEVVSGIVVGSVNAVLRVDAASAVVAHEFPQVCQSMEVNVALSQSFVPVVKYAGKTVEPPMSA